MTATDALIAELQQQSEIDGTWSVSSDELDSIYDPVDYYRASYQVEQLGVDRYGPQNAGEFAELVSTVAQRDYRPELRAAGLYLTHEDRIELTGRFVRSVRAAIVLHTPEPETFRAMLRQFRRYDEAELIYIDTFLSPQRIISRCTAEYIDVRSPDSAEATLRATVETYLKLLLQRHVVEIRALGQTLFDILQTVARAEGLLRGPTADASDGESETGDGGPNAADPNGVQAITRAKDLLELRGVRLTRSQVQKAYRAKMRRYHPDVNPSGLEMAKRINHAYGVLLAAIAES